MPVKLIAYAVGCLASFAAIILIRSIRVRQALLLGVSYVLYLLWGPWFLGILLFSSVCNYFLGAHLKRHITQGRLWVAIGFNLTLLGTFKYLPELANSSLSFGALHSLRQFVLPLGISFWTFQALSYLFDLYREEELNPSLLEFCLYMAFWPTVISGPICRLSNMLPQFRGEKPRSWNDYGIGLRRIGIGFFMLGVAQLLADGLAPGQGINAGFKRMDMHWSALDAWILAVGYGFQLFMDFAGYTHLVIGAARLFGFELQENFHRPYLSTSPSVSGRVGTCLSLSGSETMCSCRWRPCGAASCGEISRYLSLWFCLDCGMAARCCLSCGVPTMDCSSCCIGSGNNLNGGWGLAAPAL